MSETVTPSSNVPIIITTRRVPNVQPSIPPTGGRIAIIGEAPGEDEINYGHPFVGASGKLLDGLLHSVGINRRQCFVGYVCQQRPPGNDILRFDWDGDEIQSGLGQLRSDLSIFNPHICVLLGGAALRAAGQSGKISDWRGSLFNSVHFDGTPRKCIATHHPASVLRDWSGFPLLKFDLSRAARESLSPALVLPQRELITDLDPGLICHLLDTWPTGHRCSLDIEGGLSGWPCVSVCGNPLRSFTIAWGKFDEFNHGRVLQAFARLMSRRDVPKVLQNSLYDNFVLSYGFGILIRNVTEDTMLKGWEHYCELPKGLGTQASIWTREPAYKFERKSDDVETFYRYCAKDSAVTLEICEAQDSALTPQANYHYRQNVSMLNPLLFMELRGIRYDTDNVARQLAATRNELSEVGEVLNQAAGTELRGKKGSLSSQRLAKALYETLGYPPQYKKENGRKTDKLTTDVEAILALRKSRPGDSFLDKILTHRHLEGILETLEIKPDADGRVRCGYNVVGTETGRLTCYTSPTGAGANLQTITKKLRVNYCADPGHDFFQCDLAGADGWTVAAHSVRLGDPTMFDDYVAGLKPAKIVCGLYTFGPDFNGLDRDSLVFWGGKVPFGLISDAVGTGIYDCAKRVQHGSNYLMGIPTMQKTIMIASFKETGTPIYMEHRDALDLQRYYFLRYPGIRTWHQWSEAQLRANGTLTSASGHTRTFFGRRFGKDIHDTLKEFLAHEPQNNTTWATNLAMLRLWKDPANRCVGVWDNPVDNSRHFRAGDGKVHIAPPNAKPLLSRLTVGALFVEPLHTVHDALCGQWPQFMREWARGKVREWFQNPLTIAGTTLTIPFDGAFGPSWGEQPHKL